MKTLTALLTPYGFSSNNNELRFSAGGSVAGVEVAITMAGELVHIHTHEWYWNGADVEWQKNTELTCHLSPVWEYIPVEAYRMAR